VADYRPGQAQAKKMKKSAPELNLPLERTEDILAVVAAREGAPFSVGFAAETDEVEVHARDKLVRKQLDMIAANRVGEGLGFNVDENALTVLWADGQQEIPRADKAVVAGELIEIIAERYHAKSTSQNS
jgi:phosphopantothenoylcysteine decarboxylase/phosphopantothenate--cysteine ligase